MTARLTLLLGCALAIAACGQHHPGGHRLAFGFRPTASEPRLPLKVAPDVVVRRAQFGVLETTADGEDRFTPLTELPAEEGRVFGWVLEIETSRESLHWQEHLQLPRAPLDWGEAASDPDVIISKDGRSVVAQGDDLVEDGELSRFYWALAAGDPQGEYELDVAVEGKSVAHFAFRVPAPVHEKAILVHAEPAPPESRRGSI